MTLLRIAKLIGLRLAQVPDYMAAAAVKSGHLAEVLLKFKPKPLPISLVFSTNRQIPQRLRVLIDLLAKRNGRRKAGRQLTTSTTGRARHRFPIPARNGGDATRQAGKFSWREPHRATPLQSA